MKKSIFIASALLAAVVMQAQGFDPNSSDVLSVYDAITPVRGQAGDTSDYCYVRGVVPEDYSPMMEGTLEDGGTISFRLDGEESGSLEVKHMSGLNNAPFVSAEQLHKFDTLYIYGQVYNPNGWWGYQLINAHLVYQSLRSRPMVNASSMYDFNGDGIKQAVYETELALDVANAYIEDVNGDGTPDIADANTRFLLMSNATGYNRIDDAFAVTNMDVNGDGRIDYLVLNRNVQLSNNAYAYYGDIAYQLADGTFRTEPMYVMTWDEFVAQMTPEELDQYNNPQNYSLGEVSRYSYSATLGGWSLARAPRRNAPEQKKAPGIGHTINAPTKAVDLNSDGLMDLIDEKDGIIYTNMGNGKWVWSMTNGIVIPADLNNDGIMDFIFPGAKLYTAIYNRTTEQFDITTLYQNVAVDDIVYCYDFDKDGDLDLLATFSAGRNSTGYAYTCFFTNNGQGVFTQQDEQDYGENDLTFKALQDLNGDGWYDLLAFRKTGLTQYELVWVQGQSGLQFSETPQLLGTIDTQVSDGTFWSMPNVYNLICNAEDLNGDGIVEIWTSGIDELTATPIYTIAGATANTRPTAPAQPTVNYNNGILTVTWGNGTDTQTQPADLTYALRIGTTTGGNEILAAHANVDGTRRNFLDGNMGKRHSYTIDLRSYAPATVYVAVQTIDALHSGSLWSQEATAVHDLVPVDFALDKTKIGFNETIELTYTALPTGYTHQWTIQDGSYVADGNSKLILSFTSGGTKTITHTVTTPTGGTLTASATVEVMPAGIGEAISITDEQRTVFFMPMADFTYDGRMDGVLPTNRSSGSYYGLVVQKGNADNLFNKAAGLWNTNILTEGMYVVDGGSLIWYDWNKDGHVDLLFKERYGYNYNYAYLPHTSGTTLSARVDDEALADFFLSENYEGQKQYVLTDVDNNGYLDSVAMVLNPIAGTDSYGSDICGLYVWYKEGENIIAEGFIAPAAGNEGCTITDCYLTPNEHCIVVNNPSTFGQILYPIVTQADERPTAPTNIQAIMTDDGLLITWTAAVDDHTPAALMRYNLSVKQQGATTYVISPQNGGNEDAAYLPRYDYIEGTSYLIPTSELGVGRYDIRLQALDCQNKLSVFSQTVTATVMRNPIEVQSFGCANDYITVSYMGEETTGTPVWNFDGGAANGEGFGPYEVYWETGGEKTIRLTLDGQTYTAAITIDNPGELAVSLPNVLYIGTPATATVPIGVRYEWYAQLNNGELHPIDEYGIILNLNEHHEVISTIVTYDYRIKANGLIVTAQDASGRQSLTLEEVVLYLHVTNANGCEAWFMTPVTVMAATAIPTLTLVTTDVNGHNVINWTNADAFATVNIYKEGNALNDFALIGSAAATAGLFTDVNSDAAQKAERYRVTGVLANGNESPASGVHKTVHLTISRGVVNGTFNLIWNEYVGAPATSYKILRGATPASLAQIAVVAVSNTSFTDHSPVDEQPYYAIEYILNTAAAAPSVKRAPQATYSGRSNIVDRRNAEEGIEDLIVPADKAAKIFHDGTLYILMPDGKVYDAKGMRLM